MPDILQIAPDKIQPDPIIPVRSSATSQRSLRASGNTESSRPSRSGRTAPGTLVRRPSSSPPRGGEYGRGRDHPLHRLRRARRQGAPSSGWWRSSAHVSAVDALPAFDAPGVALAENDIAFGLSIDQQQVENARKVATSKVATTTAEKHDLTFDQALVLADFQEDKAAVKELTEVVTKRPDDWAHAVSELRQDRENARIVAEAVKQYEDQGYAVA